jgi:tRNA modification GTPase
MRIPLSRLTVVLREALSPSLPPAPARPCPANSPSVAFLNGRMDLTQAESVVDLIESETAEARP